MKNSSFGRSALLCLLFIVLGCKQENGNNRFSSREDFVVEKIQKWYSKLSRSGRRVGKYGDEVLWAGATHRKLAKEDEMVIVPMLSGNFPGCRIRDGRRGKMQQDENLVSGRIQRHLVVSKLDSGVTAMEMRIVFDADYTPKIRNGAIDPRNFAGKVYFFDMDGKPIRGLIYENGRQVAIFGSHKSGDVSNVAEICTDWYYQCCVDDYESSGWVYQATICEMVYTTTDVEAGFDNVFSSALYVALTAGSNFSFEAMLYLPHVREFWRTLNNTEKQYFENAKWLIPQAAFAHYTATAFTQRLYCNDSDDGNGNAFRHAVWAAILCMQFGNNAALRICSNHQSGATPIEKEMHSYNSDLGIKACKDIMASLNTISPDSSSLKLNLIVNTVLKKIIAGQGKRLIPANVAAGTSQTFLRTNGAGRCL